MMRLNCFIIFFSLFLFKANAATYTATVTGNWNAAIWNTAGTPGVADVVNIPGGFTVTIPASYRASCTTLNINSNTASSNTALLFAASTSSLSVSANCVLGCPAAPSADRTCTMDVNGGNASIGGTFAITGDKNGGNRFDWFVYLKGGTLSITGNITMTSDHSQADAVIDISQANSKLVMGGSITISGGNNGQAISNSSGSTATTIEYSSTTATQTIYTSIAGNAITYNSLTLSGSTQKDLQANTTINGNLTISNTAVFNLNSNNFGLKGNWNNTSTAADPLTEGTNSVTFGGTGAQTISNSGDAQGTDFADVTISNTSASAPQITVNCDMSVSGTLTLSLPATGYIDLNTSNTIVLGTGTAAGTRGTLSRTNGWIVGGTFKRWFSTATIADGNAQGLFPMGTSSYYRPFYVYFPNASGPSAGGTASVKHTNATTVSVVSFADGVSTVVRRHDASYQVITADGLTVAANDTYTRLEGTGFGQIGDVNHLRMVRVGSSLGTAGTNGGSTTIPQVRRYFGAVPVGGSNITYYLGSVDASNSPLPIELLSFEANRSNDKKIELNWSTSSEINNDYFTVEKSKDGINFEEVVIVDGAGTTTIPKDYAKVDNNPFAGVSYYRLKQTDFDGHFSYSDLSAVSLLDESVFAFALLSNPANSDLSCVFTGLNTITDVSVGIFDIIGKLVYSESINSGGSDTFDYTISTGKNFSNGLYFVKAEYNESVYTQKLVIQ